MIIHRSHHDSNFTIIPNATLRDPRLSYEARGVLMYLLSLPPGSPVTVDALRKEARARRGPRGEGRDKITNVFAELETTGYFRRIRSQASRGRFGTELHVYDTPQTDNGSGGQSVPPGEMDVPAGRTDYATGGQSVAPTGYATWGQSVRPAQTGVSAGSTGYATGGQSVPPGEMDVPAGRTDYATGGQSIRSTRSTERSSSGGRDRADALNALRVVAPDVTDEMFELALDILERRGARHPERVLYREIDKDNARSLLTEVRRTGIAEQAPVWPEWCGECEREGRWVYDGQERAMHCPRCHPLGRERQPA
jgi:hypothetical protein